MNALVSMLLFVALVAAVSLAVQIAVVVFFGVSRFTVVLRRVRRLRATATIPPFAARKPSGKQVIFC